MYDFHVHSNYSDDARATMVSMAEAGKNAGLNGICFTDHADLEDGLTKKGYQFSYSDYINELNSIRALFPEDFEIFSGIELGMQPHVCTQNTALVKDKDFDFIIGSIHKVTGKNMYTGDFLIGKSDKEGIKSYFEDMLFCIDNFRDFDVLGHLDGIRRYLKGGEGSFSYYEHTEEISAVLKKLIDLNKGIEVNTSGLRYRLSSFHPLPEIIKLYRSLGGEIVTLGSDSHTPSSLGFELKNVLPVLLDFGFRYYAIFRNRKPEFIKI